MAHVEDQNKFVDDNEAHKDQNDETISEGSSRSIKKSFYNDKVKRSSSFGQLRNTPLQLKWENIRISAPPKGGCCKRAPVGQPDKLILDNVNGTVKPGHFLAIIGASGAGKTTLLNFLANKDPSKNLTKSGIVSVNGVNRQEIRYSEYIAYVQQDDILLQSMTVRECLIFSARMRLPDSVDKEQRVQELIDSLKLNKCSETKIGGPMLKGVSGGERKRTSIGVELITNPNLIFLDEPTTGLDSFTATNVIEVLKDLASSGRTVISTIHQPNSEIFDMFDKLMLIAHGRTLYFNDSHKAVGYFKELGYECPSLTNPADYFMNMMSIEAYDENEDDDEEDLKRSESKIEHDYVEKITFLADKYDQSSMKVDLNDIHPEAKGIDRLDGSDIGFLRQFMLLLVRSLKNIIRIPLASYVKVMNSIITAIIAILVFGQIDDDCQQATIQSRNGVLFFITLTCVMNSIQNVILLFPDERVVFLREQASGMYSPTAYFTAKIASEIPGFIIFPSVFCVIIYFGVSLNTTDASHYFIFHVYSIILVIACSAFGLVIGSAIADKQVAVATTPVLIVPFMLFAGFFVNQNNIPFFLKPFEYISLFKYGFQVYMYNEYDGLDLGCQGRDPLKENHFKQTMSESIIITIALGVGFFLLSYLILLLVARRSK